MVWWIIVWLVVLTIACVVSLILWYWNIDTQADIVIKLEYMENRVNTIEERLKRHLNYIQENENNLFDLKQKVENMTNAEKYKKEIRNQGCYMACAVNRIIDKRDAVDKCIGCCDTCKTISIEWLMKEYEEPPVDWSKVKSGTSILVKFSESANNWIERQFAFYVNETVWYTIDGGIYRAPYAKLKD